jgi:DNA-binding transcriptional LysR family regulator
MKSSYAKTQNVPGLADLELVLALVRGRTLAGAAERLKVDTSTVFRSVKRLEKQLGEVLFDRGRQGYQPTDLALELALHAERIESHLQEAREAAAKCDAEPSGLLRVTTTDSVLHAVLMPIMAGFARAYPRIELELVVSNALANLSQRDADVAIRATRKPPEHLVGTRLGTLRLAVFASRDYLARHPGKRALEELDWIALDDTLPDHPSQKWRRQHLPKLRPQYRVNSVLSVASAVLHGMGVGVAPLLLLQDNPQVQIVAGPFEELDVDLWALAHPDIRQLQRVKALFDFLRGAIRLP